MLDEMIHDNRFEYISSIYTGNKLVKKINYSNELFYMITVIIIIESYLTPKKIILMLIQIVLLCLLY